MSRLAVLPDTSTTAAGQCGQGLTPIAGVDGCVVAEKGFAGNVLLVTLGCAKNLVDSEIMLGAFQQRGYRPITSPEQADVILVNTCSFLQSAVEEGIDRILEMAEYKKSGRCRKLIVAGCMVERYRDELRKSLPEVDQFVSTDELLRVGGDESSTTQECFDSARRPYFLYDETMPRLRSTDGYTAFVKIAEGCDRPCAFCIIPKIRGSFRSRPLDSVVREVLTLADDGVKEINFVAQDLTAYGLDLPQNGAIARPQLSALLQRLENELHGRDLWLRLLYAYPIGVDEALIRTIRDSRVIVPYLDIPLQHISNPVLKRMNRPLGEKGTRKLVEEMRHLAPDMAIRSTFIVGFPGETEEDIVALEQFIGEGHFTHVGVFPYSQEVEAKSFQFDNQVPDEVKEERLDRLMSLQQKMLATRYEGLVGKEVPVLIEGLHAESDLLMAARTAWQAPETDGGVIINEFAEDLELYLGNEANADADRRSELKGRFGRLEVTEVAGYDLVGKLNSLG